MKIGDLVRRHNGDMVGVVVDTSSNHNGLKYVKIRWPDQYGTFWSPIRAVEVVSENR